jgi:biopolymer transport protein ExbD
MSFTQREARNIIRKAKGRVPEGQEIRHLNIMPMMDMMTILIVAFVFQAATSATELTAGTVSLPKSMTDDDLPENTSTLIITKSSIVVEGVSIVSVNNGDVSCDDREGGCQGNKITKLTQFLSNLHQAEVAKAQATPGAKPFDEDHPPELLIIADRTTPYRLLVGVMFSAKQPEAGYKRFRLIVQKAFPNKPKTP